tara:strand:+ start:283 stop:522 length:240 start_codon:yes stop_codon:yes gene_type:complete
MENKQSDVWKLESEDQEQACNTINYLYERARAGQVYPRNVLKRVFGDNWDTIKERMETGGSCWYVWYMDGVNNYLQGQH